MIIYLHGTDDYRIGQQLSQYISQSDKKYGSDLETEKFDLGDKNGLERFKNFISVSSMFGGYKLAILKEVSKFSDIEGLKDLIRNSSLEQSEKEIIIVVDVSSPNTGWQSKSPKKKRRGVEEVFFENSQEIN